VDGGALQAKPRPCRSALAAIPLSGTAYVVDQLVEFFAGELVQRAPVGQDSVKVGQPLEDVGERLVGERLVGEVAAQLGEVFGRDEFFAGEGVIEVVVEDCADELGGGDVGAQHPAVVDAVGSVPVLEWTVAPGAVGG
jgi:hypothetical protein